MLKVYHIRCICWLNHVRTSAMTKYWVYSVCYFRHVTGTLQVKASCKCIHVCICSMSSSRVFLILFCASCAPPNRYKPIHATPLVICTTFPLFQKKEVSLVKKRIYVKCVKWQHLISLILSHCRQSSRSRCHCLGREGGWSV